MRAVPTATYRVQLTREFGFRECAAVVPYLEALGITTVYCSPVLQAIPGSTHGYDVVDPTRISDDLGGESGWRELVDAVRRSGMTILLDIVPNHMAATITNPWWRDILEYGRLSPYVVMFDIDWEPPLERLRDKVLLPVLPEPLGHLVEQNQLTVHITASGLVLRYGALEWPLALRSYRHVLAALMDARADALCIDRDRVARSLSFLDGVASSAESASDRYERQRAAIHTVTSLLLSNDESCRCEDEGACASEEPLTVTLSPRVLRRVLREQHYLLSYWKSGRHHINYRRFFDIGELVAVRVEDDTVFERTHSLIRELASSTVMCGFRVDHVDGLRAPLRYLRRLRSVVVAAEAAEGGHTPYIVVEKILSGDESLPAGWPIDGTTGYDFLNEVAGLFVDAAGLSLMRRHHRSVTGMRATRAQLTYRNKRKVLMLLFGADLTRLSRCLAPVASWLYPSAHLSSGMLNHVLAAVTAALPSYRTYYSGSGSLSTADRTCIESALGRVRPGGAIDVKALDVVHRALLLDIPDEAPAMVRRAVRAHLVRWQQLSGAAMAKGFEDTTLYQDSRFIALNAVGSRDTLSATTLEHFHSWNKRRRRAWPHTMNCTATHDAKRGEDVRARIAVLSEFPEEWSAAVTRWLSTARRDPVAGPLMGQIDLATHLFLLQTVLGAWPEPEAAHDFAPRLVEYMVKSVREAKTRSSWLGPDEAYEGAITGLIEHMVTKSGSMLFLDCFGHLIEAMRFHGLVNSVSQVLLKATCPGVPDTYQGTEVLDLSLVDPDNRRPVDYRLRQTLLEELNRDNCERPSTTAAILAQGWPDSRAKLHVLARVLEVRKLYPSVFLRGSFAPLYSTGEHRNRVCAFGRSYGGTMVIAVVPLCSRLVAAEMQLPLGSVTWESEALRLPAGRPDSFCNAITGERLYVHGGALRLADTLATFPVALLVGTDADR